MDGRSSKLKRTPRPLPRTADHTVAPFQQLHPRDPDCPGGKGTGAIVLVELPPQHAADLLTEVVGFVGKALIARLVAAMHTVEVRLQGNDIGTKLMEFRVWLDSHKYENARFVYKRRDILGFRGIRTSRLIRCCFRWARLERDTLTPLVG